LSASAKLLHRARSVNHRRKRPAIISGTDANGCGTSGMVTPMGKQRIYTGPMFEGGQH
jgi:hypothetical protein